MPDPAGEVLKGNGVVVFGVVGVAVGQGPALALDELEDELGIHPSDLTGLPAGGIALAECGGYDPGTEPTEQDVVYRTIDLPEPEGCRGRNGKHHPKHDSF